MKNRLGQNTDSDVGRLRASRERWNATLRSLGLPVRRPIEGLAPHAFSARQARDLETFGRTLRAVARDGRDLRRPRSILDYSLRALGLTCEPSFGDSLGPDDVVEGYGLDQRQIFRNFRFMEICGYDLHDIMTYDWMTLYERPQRITRLLLEKVDAMVRANTTIELDDVPAHYLKERMSEHRQVIQMRCRRLGPLYRGAGRLAGFVFSCGATLIDEAPDRHELRFI